MKRTIYIAVTILLMLLNATVNAQDTQEADPNFPCFVKTEGCVWDEYDRFQDKTFVTMTPIRLTFPPVLGYPSSVYVEIGAEFSSPGNTIKRPDTVTTKFIVLSVDPFKDKKGVYLLIDGKPVPLGDVASEQSESIYEKRYSLQMPFDVVEKVASAKVIEIRLGSEETTFNEKLKVPFRRLVEIVPKKESPAMPKATPRTKPTRTSRQRGRP